MTTTLQRIQNSPPATPFLVKGWLTFLVIVCYLPLFSQPTIDNNILPKIGDTIILANDNLPDGIAILPAKGEQEWDFMKLQSAFSKKTVAKKVIKRKGQTIFPNSDIYIEDL